MIKQIDPIAFSDIPKIVVQKLLFHGFRNRHISHPPPILYSQFVERFLLLSETKTLQGCHGYGNS